MIQPRRLVLICVALLPLGAPVALAQLSVGNGGGGSKPGADAKKDTPEPPPPAIPGAQSSPELVAPPDKVAAEMNPNDALFRQHQPWRSRGGARRAQPGRRPQCAQRARAVAA